MVCNLEICFTDKKNTDTTQKTQMQLTGKIKQTTQLTTESLKENATHITHVHTRMDAHPHTHQRKQKTRSLIHDMRRTGNPSRRQIPSVWSWTFSSGIRSI